LDLKQRALLILPVENQVRELDSKLLFGCFAVERGFDVILGSRAYVNYAMTKLRKGVFVAKSMRRRSALMLNIIQDLGHHVVAWDEESLVRFESEEYDNWRFSEKTFSSIDHLFAWGDDDASMFSRYRGLGQTDVHVTGNPRMDLLRKEFRGIFSDEVKKIRQRYGKFVLINTNFSFVNSFVKDLNLLIRNSSSSEMVVSRTGEGMSEQFALGMFRHQERIARSFVSLMSVISSGKPETQFVLRPHPSENHDFWRNIVSGLPNVEVVHEGNVVPWILASQMLVHNGCTTAVEATLLEKPVISYQPIYSEYYDYHLPNGLSQKAGTEQEVLQLINTIEKAEAQEVNRVDCNLLKKHLTASEGLFASERILDIVESEIFLTNGDKRVDSIRFIKAWLMGTARTTLKKINGLRPGHRNSKLYHDHRFPKISSEELQNKVRTLDSVLHRFGFVRIKPFSENLFLMGRDG